MSFKKSIPKMTVGRYAGTPIDQLPNSYLRWMIGQNFPKEWLEIAKRKLAASAWNDEYMHVTRHALDMFSKRFLKLWVMNFGIDLVQAQETTGHICDENAVGIATFVARMAQEAFEKGADVSKYRHQDDGIVREYEGIQWVFSVSRNFPDYKELITVMPGKQ